MIGHSLGNMVVSSAIKDHNLNVAKYFMLDAAVAIEAYSPSQLAEENMRPITWILYSNRTWAANWHKLWNFNTNDARSNLTWLSRFGDIPNAVNYYSCGEEVLQNSPQDPSTFLCGVTLSWAYQELIKGRWQSKFLVSETDYGGWGFNPHPFRIIPGEPAPRPERVNNLTNAALRLTPVHKPFYDSRLHYDDPIGSQLAGDYTIRSKLLAEAIPALSFATGANLVPFYFNDNIDMMEFKNGNEWPLIRIAHPEKGRRWLHGDFRDVANIYNYKLFDDICSPARGGLQ